MCTMLSLGIVGGNMRTASPDMVGSGQQQILHFGVPKASELC